MDKRIYLLDRFIEAWEVGIFMPFKVINNANYIHREAEQTVN